jgi:hypothetical protein
VLTEEKVDGIGDRDIFKKIVDSTLIRVNVCQSQQYFDVDCQQ